MEKDFLHPNNKCIELLDISGQVFIHVDDKAPLPLEIYHSLKIRFNLKDKQPISTSRYSVAQNFEIQSSCAGNTSEVFQPRQDHWKSCCDRRSDVSTTSCNLGQHPDRLSELKYISKSGLNPDALKSCVDVVQDFSEDDIEEISQVCSGTEKNDFKRVPLAPDIKEEPVSDEANIFESLEVTFDPNQTNSDKNKPSSSASKDKGPYKIKPCKYCGNQYDNLIERDKHFHALVPDAKCEKCGLVLSCKAKLLVHEHEKHPVDKASEVLDHDKDDKLFSQCPVCSKQVRTKGFIDHICLIHTKEMQYKCCVCGKLYYTRRQLYDHAMAHINPEISKINKINRMISSSHTNLEPSKTKEIKIFKPCNYCGKEFKNKSDKKEHHRGPTPPAQCLKCKSVFSCQAKLLVHEKIKHSDDRDDVLPDIRKNNQVFSHCPVCSEQIKKINLVDHVSSMHTRELKNKCCVCEEVFYTASQLYQHARGHLNPDNYRKKGQWNCSLCPQVFYDKGEFHKHSYTHRTVCTFCKKDFTHKHFLEKHLQAEHADKLLTCKICGKQVATEAQLYTHTRHHRYGKSVPCPICGVMIRNCNLSFHIDSKHPEETKRETDFGSEKLHGATDISNCSVVGKDSSITAAAFKTLSTHPPSSSEAFLCTHCPKTFANKKRLHQHNFRFHGPEGKVSCPQCEKKLLNRNELSRHIRNVHIRANIYTCEVCGKQCNLKSNLKIHMRIHSYLKLFNCHICNQGFNYKASLKSHLKSKHNAALLV